MDESGKILRRAATLVALGAAWAGAAEPAGAAVARATAAQTDPGDETSGSADDSSESGGQGDVDDGPPPALEGDPTGDPTGSPRLRGDDSMPLALEHALGLALSNNLGLERAAIQSEVARFDTLSAYGAFDWVFDVRTQYTDSTTEGATSLAGGDTINTTESRADIDITRPFTWGGTFAFHFDTSQPKTDNSFFNNPELVQDNVRLSYTQPLLRGFGTEANLAPVRETQIAQRQRDQDRRLARQGLLHDVEVAYWELVAALEQLEVAESALDLGENQVRREEARRRAGDGTEVDILQAQTDVATRREALLQAQNDVVAREDELKQLIFNDADPDRWNSGLSPRSSLPEARDRTGVLDVHWIDAYQVALDHRPDIRNARLDVDAARVRWNRSRNQRLHGLDLQISASSNGVDPNFSAAFTDSSEFRFPSYSASLSYNMPLQNRTASGAEQAARATLRGLQVALQEMEIMALAEIRAALREVRFRSQAVVAAEQSLELAERQLDAERRRFNADLSTTFQVLEFQQTLIEARMTRIRARVEFAKARVALFRALGSLGERSELLPQR